MRFYRFVSTTIVILAITALSTGRLFAQQAKEPGEGEKPKAAKADGGAEKASVTDHEMTIGGRVLHYRATAATLGLKDETGKPKADVFYVAYEKLADQPGKADRKGDGATTRPATGPATEPSPAEGSTVAKSNPAARPVTFVFNGGPGAAAVWLHLGTVGPRRVKLTPSGEASPPPAVVEDNPATWLDATDLVFIDPVGTGYSRPAPGEKQEEFSGVQEDAKWVGEFIRLYTSRNGRWPSPKFLAGESYGTTRAAALSDYLLDRHGIAVNGIVFISVVLQFQTISLGSGNELPYALYVPTYTATAWYHKKLADDLQKDLSKALKASEAWAINTYLPALAKGKSLTDREADDVAKDLSRYTGLTVETVKKAGLRIDPGLFRSALLGGQRKLIGRFDGRLTGYEVDPLNRDADFDPSLSPFLAAYTTAFNDYIRRELKFESDQSYEVLTGRVQPWNFGRSGAGYLDVADNLQDAMRKNVHLHVLFCSGLFDLATPYLATNYTVNHLELSPELRDNVAQTFYEGGHMLYHHHPSADKLHADVKAFVEKATGSGSAPQ